MNSREFENNLTGGNMLSTEAPRLLWSSEKFQLSIENCKLGAPENGKIFNAIKVVLCNLVRLGTVIVLFSSGKDFVNTPHLYSYRPIP